LFFYSARELHILFLRYPAEEAAMLVKQKEKYLPTLRNFSVFKYFSDEALLDFFGKSEILSFKDGETIIQEGDKSPYFYAVLEGTANVTVETDSKDVFISTSGEGAVFGEAGIFLNVKRTANVMSAADSVLLRIHRNDLLHFIKERPSDGIKFLMIIIYSLLKKLRGANQELAFERKSDFAQDDIDAMVKEIMSE
jgi:CRP/FNR family transcriptional regulator, cyclic AMP receptor protein